MLKLKYLFNNEDLAKMILGNWEYDRESIEMFKYYRISSNAIYPFQMKGKTQFLRFAPKSGKRRNNILAELEFISYLRSRQYGVLEAVSSKNDRELIEAETPWGAYYATVFKRVTGVQLNQTDVSDQIIMSYGKALGKLHKLSNQYIPTKYKRWSYSDVLDWIYTSLLDFPQEKEAINETKRLQNYFSTVPKTNENYGLIHYDFEYDNVFYDEVTKSCNVIDFDDAMYHWYVMDIEQALDSLEDCISSDLFQAKKTIFLDGYSTEYEISEDTVTLVPACKSFATLYGYVRVLKSIEETWENEPEWMVSLRKNLKKGMEDEFRSFENEKLD